MGVTEELRPIQPVLEGSLSGALARLRCLGRQKRDGENLLAFHEALQLIGRSYADITHPDDVAADRAALAKLLSGDGDSLIREKRYLRPDGTVVWCRINVTVVRDATGRPECMGVSWSEKPVSTR